MEIREVEYIKEGFFGFLRKPLIGVLVYIDENESKKPAWEISRDVEMEAKLSNKRYRILSIRPKTFNICPICGHDSSGGN